MSAQEMEDELSEDTEVLLSTEAQQVMSASRSTVPPADLNTVSQNSNPRESDRQRQSSSHSTTSDQDISHTSPTAPAATHSHLNTNLTATSTTDITPSPNLNPAPQSSPLFTFPPLSLQLLSSVPHPDAHLPWPTNIKNIVIQHVLNMKKYIIRHPEDAGMPAGHPQATTVMNAIIRNAFDVLNSVRKDFEESNRVLERLREEREEMRRERDEARERVEELEDELEVLGKGRDEARKRVEEVEGELEEMRKGMEKVSLNKASGKGSEGDRLDV